MLYRRTRPLSLASLFASSLLPSTAAANGRMPGANDIVFDGGDPAHLVARATFGIMQSFDSGASFQWICERIIDVSGVVSDPPLGVMHDGSLVLLPPTGSALISHDHGCSFAREEAELAGQRGVDLTVDPGDPHRVLLLMSTIDEIDLEGYAIFRNTLSHSTDDAKTFSLLSNLPSDFEAETVEVAKSSPLRIYVSGTSSKNGRLGILERSEDGGKTWTRRTLDLPPGSGSLFISGIAPDDADRLWVRIPARGDTLGILPARLMFSTDGGDTFEQLAATQKAMFGFALSPDGKELAYGGPSDGLFVGPSDGSGPFEKKNELGVRCLRWTEQGGLYACGSEPQDPFSVGVSYDRGVTFMSLYRMRDTCPQACDESSLFNRECREEWALTSPFIRAEPLMCAVEWSTPDTEPVFNTDAGVEPDAATPSKPDDRDAAPSEHDASAPPKADGCGCRLGPEDNAARVLPWFSLLFGLFGFRRSRRRARKMPSMELS